jgi:tetratricopeptide (TPR) repeat protein
VWPQAHRLYTQALDLLDPADDAGRFRFLLGRSRVRAERWDDTGAREDAQAAMELADRLGDPSGRAQALLRLSGASARAGDWRRADEEVEAALELFDGVGDMRGRAEALRQRGMAYLLSGDQRSAEEPIACALDAFRAVGDRRGEAWSLQNLAWIAFTDGRVERAERFVEASERAFREAGDSGGLAWVQGLAAFVKFQQGDFDTARDTATRILRESERRGDRFGQGMMHVVLAGVELWTGHPRAAATGALSAVASFRESGDTVGLEQALGLAGRASVMAGEVDRGWELLDEAVAAGGDSPEMSTTVRRFTEVQVGHPEALLGPEGEAWATARAGDSQRLALRALALAQASREPEALPVAREAVSAAPDGGFERCVLALVAAANGESAEAERSAGTARALRGATYLDRVLADLAAALVDLGQDGARALEAARRELALGEDVLTGALVVLAAATRAEAVGGDGTEQAEADRALAAIGLADTRWRDLFRRIVGHAVRS